MTTYVVERMSEDSYGEYMLGGYNYRVEHLHIEAENVEEAIKKAQKPGYVVNDRYVRTLEELEQEKAELERRWAEEEAKKRAQAEKRKATEARKAEEMGLSVEEYRKLKNLKRYLNQNLKELADMAKRTVELEEDNRRLEAKIARLEGKRP